MMSLARPTEQEIAARLARYAGAPFAYDGVGASRAGRTPPGYVQDHNRIEIGVGPGAFRLGTAAIRAMTMFPAPWIRTFPAAPAVREGTIIGVLAPGLGLWTLSFCRIVYVIDEATRFGFAYGTLAEHVEMGEERFLVEWDRASGRVTYDLFAFSRPRHPLARLGNLYVRRLQRRFQRLSMAAMKEAARA